MSYSFLCKISIGQCKVNVFILDSYVKLLNFFLHSALFCFVLILFTVMSVYNDILYVDIA